MKIIDTFTSKNKKKHKESKACKTQKRRQENKSFELPKCYEDKSVNEFKCPEELMSMKRTKYD